VTSEPGQGSRFVLCIPVEICAPEIREPAPRPAAEAPKATARHVLVVDDNEINRMLIVKILEAAGMSAVAVDSGERAFELLARGPGAGDEEPFEAVLMDIQMPGLDGIETTRCIRRLSNAYRDIPVIAVTAHDAEEDADERAKAGMNGYVAKPIDAQKLCEQIELATAPANRVAARA